MRNPPYGRGDGRGSRGRRERARQRGERGQERREDPRAFRRAGGREPRRESLDSAYAEDYTRSVRWGYQTRTGRGDEDSPYMSGGSVGRGYGRAADLGFGPPPTVEDRVYVDESDRWRGAREPGSVRRPLDASMRRGRRRRPGTANRARDPGYPYFGSAAAAEAAVGYPPGDSLNPEIPVRGRGPDPSFYDDEY